LVEQHDFLIHIADGKILKERFLKPVENSRLLIREKTINLLSKLNHSLNVDHFFKFECETSYFYGKYLFLNNYLIGDNIVFSRNFGFFSSTKFNKFTSSFGKQFFNVLKNVR
jgi:hypothetical protein